MRRLPITTASPSSEQLKTLEQRGRSVLKQLREDECELRRPIFLEFAGLPKSGKSSIIGIVAHFFRRTGFRVVQPPEGASLRTPRTLRDDWLAFNAWSACYALTNILELSHEQDPDEIVFLDRGLLDVAAWMHFLCVHQRRITPDDQAKITSFATLDIWRKRELLVFLFTCDGSTSEKRENKSKLIESPGSVMNAGILSGLRASYEAACKQLEKEFQIWNVDTSFIHNMPIDFQTFAYAVCGKVIELMEGLLRQKLLVTDRIDEEGFIGSVERTDELLATVIQHRRFMERQEAEASPSVQQLVPYGLLKNADGKYFHARRRSEHPRRELRGKYTILVGGHAEEKDWDETKPELIFERCLRRELEEELIGISIIRMKRVGLLNDPRSNVGSRHIAVLFDVEVGGAPKVRRQAVDQEFGREPVSWKSENEIRASVDKLDPWSQLVAARLFGAKLPELPNEPTLFTRNR